MYIHPSPKRDQLNLIFRDCLYILILLIGLVAPAFKAGETGSFCIQGMVRTLVFLTGCGPVHQALSMLERINGPSHTCLQAAHLN